MRHNEDRIILAIAGLLLLVITVASLVDRFCPRRGGSEVEALTVEHGASGPTWAVPKDWEDRHAFYHLRGISHSHPDDQEETAKAEAAWAEELQHKQAGKVKR
jgi:hypothetical protein